MKTTWSVLILYENDDARQEAVHLCDQLVQRFWSRHEFDFSWWPFEQLREEAAAHEAGPVRRRRRKPDEPYNR